MNSINRKLENYKLKNVISQESFIVRSYCLRFKKDSYRMTSLFYPLAKILFNGFVQLDEIFFLERA